MAVDHVQVTLVHRDVDRLADRAAGVVDGRRHVGQLHEVAEVLDGRVAPPLLQVADEGRAVDRREDRGVAADLDAALEVAGVLGEGGGRGLTDDLPAHALGAAHPHAVDVGAGLLPDLQRLLVVPVLDADLLQHRVGVGLAEREAFLAEKLVDWDLALDEALLLALAAAARRPPRLAATALAPAPPRPVDLRRICHGLLLQSPAIRR